MNEWSTDFPSEEGDYWFYGDPWFGSMGQDYVPGAVPNVKMYFVQVHATGRGFIGEARGQFVTSRKFDPAQRREGYLGYWRKVDMPPPPRDVDVLFIPRGGG
jgi:hypothetical protein